MTSGLVIYDPRHRVPKKKEYAVKRRRSREALAHIVQILPLLPPHLHDLGKEVLTEYAKAPKLYQPGPRKLRTENLEQIYTLLSKIPSDNNKLLLKATAFFNDIEASLCRTTTKPWTAILRVENSVVQPFLDQIKTTKTILTPAWGYHITWVKGEEPPYKKYWGTHENQPVSFEIISEPKTTRRGHHFVHINSSEISEMRRELGLNPRPPVKLHLTYGREV